MWSMSVLTTRRNTEELAGFALICKKVPLKCFFWLKIAEYNNDYDPGC